MRRAARMHIIMSRRAPSPERVASDFYGVPYPVEALPPVPEGFLQDNGALYDLSEGQLDALRCLHLWVGSYCLRGQSATDWEVRMRIPCCVFPSFHELWWIIEFFKDIREREPDMPNAEKRAHLQAYIEMRPPLRWNPNHTFNILAELNKFRRVDDLRFSPIERHDEDFLSDGNFRYQLSTAIRQVERRVQFENERYGLRLRYPAPPQGKRRRRSLDEW